MPMAHLGALIHSSPLLTALITLEMRFLFLKTMCKLGFWTFEPRPIQPKGGSLWWIEEDTFISMDSFVLTIDELLKLALAMK